MLRAGEERARADAYLLTVISAIFRGRATLIAIDVVMQFAGVLHWEKKSDGRKTKRETKPSQVPRRRRRFLIKRKD